MPTISNAYIGNTPVSGVYRGSVPLWVPDLATPGGGGGGGGLAILGTTVSTNVGSQIKRVAVPEGTEDGDLLVLLTGTQAISTVLPEGFTELERVGSGDLQNAATASWRVASNEPDYYDVGQTATATMRGHAVLFRLPASASVGDTSGFYEINTEPIAYVPAVEVVSPSALILFTAGVRTAATGPVIYPEGAVEISKLTDGSTFTGAIGWLPASGEGTNGPIPLTFSEPMRGSRVGVVIEP